MKNAFFQKLLDNKHNKYIFIILIFGIVFMLFAGGNKKADTVDKPLELDISREEQRLATIISDIKGAGNVSVMITYYASAEKNIAYETKSSQTSKESSGVLTENLDKQAVMTSGEPTVVKEIYPEVKGVVVTAEGAADTTVKNQIKEAVQSALGVAAHKICVFEKQKK